MFYSISLPLVLFTVFWLVNPIVPFFCLTFVLIGYFLFHNLSSSRSPLQVPSGSSLNLPSKVSFSTSLIIPCFQSHHHSSYFLHSAYLLHQKRRYDCQWGIHQPPRDQTSSYCTIFSDQYSLVQGSTEATQRYFNCLCTTLWRIT